MSISSPFPAPSVTPQGQVTFGKYQLVERLGRGGMAEVWKAKIVGPAGFQRTMVVKRILPHLVEDPHFIEMFVAEARLSARLNHANIVQVFELGDVAGEYFLAMEYVRGRDLVSVMRAQLLRGRCDSGLAAYVMREVCRALAYAHALTDDNGVPLRLIHRDVSPSNVMLSFDGAVKLLDFGIAKALAEAGENQTQTGTLKGKFGYMSPEQVEGKTIDHRTDLFAAGIVLHETLTGRRLFKGQGDLQTIAMVREAKVDAPSSINPDVSPELDRIVLKALARNPDDRYRTCDEMAFDLDQVVHQIKWGPERLKASLRELFADEPSQTGSMVMAAPPPASGYTIGPSRKNARLWRIAYITTGLVAASGITLLFAGKPAPPPIEPPPPVVQVNVPQPLGPRVEHFDPPRPALSTQVRVRVQSTPPGAEVYLPGELAPRGRTPLMMMLPRSESPLKVQLRVKGFRSDTLEITPDTDASLQANLVHDTPPPRPAEQHKSTHKKTPPSAEAPPPRKVSPDLKRGDVVDPFAR